MRLQVDSARDAAAGDAGPGAASYSPPRWPTWLIVAYLAWFCAVVGGAMWLDRAADREHRLGMAFLEPAVSWLVAHRTALAGLATPVGWILPGAGILVALWVLFSVLPALRPRRAVLPRLDERLAIGAEVLCLGLLTLVVIAFRFYALGWVPNEFVGELVFHVVATSDWEKLISVAGGAEFNAPWVPVGFLYYALTGALWRFSGATVLTLCMASAVAGVVLIQVLYWLVRRLAGPLAALLAASFYAASPIEMAWGRHSMYPFNYPTIVVLLVALATYLAVTRYQFRYWLLTAFLMGLSRHSFGSAYGAFLIPILAVLWLLAFDRVRLRRCAWQLPTLLIGVVLWVLGPTLALSAGAGEWSWISPVDPRLAGRAFRGTGYSGSLKTMVENASVILRPLYVGDVGDTHQTPTAFVTSLFGDEPATILDPLVTTLFTVGVVWMLARRRDPAVAVWFSLLAAAAAPGLISIAEPHRQTALYAAICAVAGCAAAAGLAGFRSRFSRLGAIVSVVLPLAILPVLLARSGAAYFSHPAGESPSVSIARVIKNEVTPGTLLVMDLPLALAIDVTYLLFDASLAEPFGWMTVENEADVPWERWERRITGFKPSFSHLLYRSTALSHRVPELQATEWKRILFVLYGRPNPEAKLETLRKEFGTLTVKEVRTVPWQGQGKSVLTFVSVAPKLPFTVPVDAGRESPGG